MLDRALLHLYEVKIIVAEGRRSEVFIELGRETIVIVVHEWISVNVSFICVHVNIGIEVDRIHERIVVHGLQFHLLLLLILLSSLLLRVLLLLLWLIV